MTQDFETHYAAFLKAFEKHLSLDKPETLTSLYEAESYAYEGQGKRIRPYLVYLFCEFFQVKKTLALQIGAIIEKVHCYSLIHDDLPAMDDANLRRGQATVHKAYDDATAVLAGDGLLTDAFFDIAQLNIDADMKVDLLNFLGSAAGSDGMILGQAYDLHFEKNLAEFKALSDEDQLFYLYKTQFLKTGCLFVFSSLVAGALYDKDFLRHSICFKERSPKFAEFWKNHPLIAMAEKDSLDPFVQFGTLIGMLFQLVDDRLDQRGAAVTGKDSGLDARADKVNFLTYYGEEHLDQEISQLVEKAALILDRLNVPDDSPLFGLLNFVVSRDR